MKSNIASNEKLNFLIIVAGTNRSTHIFTEFLYAIIITKKVKKIMHQYSKKLGG